MMSESNIAKERRLVIFSGVPHFCTADGIVAHGGFTKEVDLWANFFGEVIVVSPESNELPQADAIQYLSKNVQFFSLGTPTNTSGIMGKLRLVFLSIFWLLRSRRLIRSDDVIMGRGPDSVGFLGYLLSRGRRNLRFAKYADQWKCFAGEPLGYRLQKWLYSRSGFGGPVLIYDSSDPTCPHLVPFFPSAVSQKDWDSAGQKIHERACQPPYKISFVGRLVSAKGVDVLLRALHILKSRGLIFYLELVGDGPEKMRLQALSAKLGLGETIRFHGWTGWRDLEEIYARSHVFVHCSHKEGFGKVILEAMSFALPVIGSDVGVSRLILDPPKCGYIVPPGEPEALAAALEKAFSDPSGLLEMGKRGRGEVVPYLLDNQETLYQSFIENKLGLSCG